MKRPVLFAALILLAGVFGLAFRLPHLSQRPMHGDEAVQAVQAGILAETGEYRYDPRAFHGPSLYYLTLPSLWLRAGGSLERADEADVRIVPVVFGAGLILLLLLVGDGLGWPAAACAALWTAISPAMVFYSRYYIQEMLLVFSTFMTIAAGWRYVRSRRIGWALLAGASAGLMHATKETCIIAYGSMLGAIVLTTGLGRWRRAAECPDAQPGPRPLKRSHLLAALAAGCIVSILFFSSFCTNPAGVLDSVRTYATYLSRAGGDPLHVHPWYTYARILLFAKYAPGPWWSEGLIVALAIAGFVVAVTRRSPSDGDPSLLRFLAFYTVLMTIAYTVIPYKTPWCALSFLHGMILLAGVGAMGIVRRLPGRLLKVAACLLLVAGSAQLAGQACRANYRFYADNRNPYVYAHPVADLLQLVKRVEEIAQVHPDGRDMLIEVIAPDSDYWPLPWYLRRFHRVGYWTEPPADADAPVIIAAESVRGALEGKLRQTYQVSAFGLRPHVVLWLYVQADLWQEFLKKVAGHPVPK